MSGADSKEMTIELSHLTIDDYEALYESNTRAYQGLAIEYWSEAYIRRLLEIFPEGQICIRVNGELVACALSLIVDYREFGDTHTYRQISGNFTFSTHDPAGDVLYGIDVWVDPKHRGLRLGRRLYEGRKELCENLNLRAIVAGGRIPNYSKHADRLSPKEYIEEVKARRIYDPTLTFQLSNGFHVKKVLKGYLEGDTESREFATLLQWDNIYYTESTRLLNARKLAVRIGLVQWQMRSLADVEALFEQVEFFVDAISNYQADFVLFPEFFCAPLLAKWNDQPEAVAWRHLAGLTQEMQERFRNLAISYNTNILTGGLPIVEDGEIMTVGWVCHRDGRVERYERIHVTPREQKAWGMAGGRRLRAFDTDAGRIGVLIGYDIEFPELGRLLADERIEILFVPFNTDTQNGYMRVRSCAQARAIENECYVALAGCVGNLPKVENMDIQYAQSAILTPFDFAFPTTGIKAEAPSSTEMTLLSDVDLELLQELHARGSVQNLKDRRPDIYRLTRAD